MNRVTKASVEKAIRPAVKKLAAAGIPFIFLAGDGKGQYLIEANLSQENAVKALRDALAFVTTDMLSVAQPAAGQPLS